MLPQEAVAIEAVWALYGRPILYTGAGLVSAPLVAIRSDSAGQPLQGFERGRSPSVSFEIRRGDLPEGPDKKNLIVEESGARWSVIDADERDDVDAWVLHVEEAPAP
jgi:hypothetical protein